MKLPISISCGSRGNEARTFSEETGKVRASSRRLLRAGFTMVEIAISLAVIGVALVAILGVLPIGMRAQRDNRERTLINQDATVFVQAIRDGAHGLSDLTNYVYAITNWWVEYAPNGAIRASGVNGYDYVNYHIDAGFPIYRPPGAMPINNGTNIIGLMSTPEFMAGYNDVSGTVPGDPIPSLCFGGISNHVVAYVHCLSGAAVEKPPQDNAILRQDSFTYRILCVNAPVAADTNIFYLNPLWQAQPYVAGDQVIYNWTYWRADSDTLATEVPGESLNWVKMPYYPLELAANLHDLRLTFLWPQLPNGRLAPYPAHQTYRTTIAGRIATETNSPAGQLLYFLQPQTFANTP
jgi:prepilin-type N-terminal cleavage/methylation domain-containing protein